jgi:hypothetical protein
METTLWTGATGPDDAVGFMDAASSVTASPSGALGDGFGHDETGQYAGIENLTGSPLADILSGDGASNVLLGMEGDDVLAGHWGADLLGGGHVCAHPGLPALNCSHP